MTSFGNLDVLSIITGYASSSVIFSQRSHLFNNFQLSKQYYICLTSAIFWHSTPNIPKVLCMHEVTIGGFLQDLLNQFFLILLGIWWLCRARSLPPQWSLTGFLAYTLGIFYKKCSKQNIFSQKWPPEGVEGFITMLLIKRVQYQSFRHHTWYLGTCKANTENIRQHFFNNIVPSVQFYGT